MTNNEIIEYIPARIRNAAKGGNVTGAEDIIDDALGKKQSVINQEVNRSINSNTEAVAAERQRAVAAEGALDNRLSDVEELAEISLDGGEAKIATGEDFHNPTAEQRVKVPTVGAILDGADDEPTAGSENLVKSGGVDKIIYGNGINLFDDEITWGNTQPGIKKLIDVSKYIGRTLKIEVEFAESPENKIDVYLSSDIVSSSIIFHEAIPLNTPHEIDVLEDGNYIWIFSNSFTETPIVGHLNIEVIKTINGLYNDIQEIRQSTDNNTVSIEGIQRDLVEINHDINVINKGFINVEFDASNNKVTIEKKQDNKIIRYSLKRFGANNLWQLYSVEFLDLNYISLIRKTVGTDSLGPYQVSAVNNIDGDNDAPPLFTGGCHGYNGDQSGTPTASSSIRVICDGVEISGNAICRKAEIIVTNKVQGWNTRKSDGSGREILQETIHYIFTSENNVDITNYIYALEDITISLYYGMQIAFCRDYVKFISEKKSEWHENNENANYIGDKLDGVISKSIDGMIQQMYVKPHGLGHFYYVPSDLPKAFQSNKIYYNLIRQECSLTEGNTLVLCGGYSFDTLINLKYDFTNVVAQGNRVSVFVDVEAFRTKEVSVSFNYDANSYPYQLIIYQSYDKTSASIISSEGNIYSGQTISINITANTKYLWLFNNIETSQDTEFITRIIQFINDKY